MKTSKVVRCMFLLGILGVDPHKTWQNTKVVMCTHTTNQWKHCDYVIMRCQSGA